MKTCLECKQILPLSSFGVSGSYKTKAGKRRQKYKPRCNSCIVPYEYAIYRKKITEILQELKRSCSCAHCGYDNYFAALEFHHIDPTAKKFKISTGVNYSKSTLKAEIQKCVLLCATHHRELHGGLIDIAPLV